MASITFGSVGDIIAISGLIAKTVSALSESRGSSAQFQGLIHELWSLGQALESVKSLIEQGISLRHRGRLGIALNQCRRCLDLYLGRMQKYSASLKIGGSGNAVKDAFWKLRWESHKDDLAAFRAEAASHVASIGTILEAAGIELSQDIHQETKAQLNEFGKRLQGGLEQCQASSKRQHLEVLGALSQQDSLGQQEHKATGAQVEQLRVATLAKLDENSSFLFQLDANIENNGSRLAQILDFVQKMTSFDSSGFVDFHVLIHKIEQVLLQHSIPRHLEKAPLIYEDPLLRKFSVDLEFIPSFETFTYIISTHFSGTRGQRKIENKEYIFEDSKHHQLDLKSRWTNNLLSGKTMFMRVTFDHDKTPRTTCPACQTTNADVNETEIECRNCGVRYQRVVEMLEQPRGPKAKQFVDGFPALHNENELDSLTKLSSKLENDSLAEEICFFKRIRIITNENVNPDEHAVKALIHNGLASNRSEAFAMLQVICYKTVPPMTKLIVLG